MRIVADPGEPGQVGCRGRKQQRDREMDDRRMERMAEHMRQIRLNTPPQSSRKPITAAPAWTNTTPREGMAFRAW